MKNKLFKSLISALVLVLTANTAFCYVLSREELNERLTSTLKIEAQNYVDKLGGGEVLVKINNLPFEDTNTKNEPKIEVKSNFDKFTYRDIKRVSIYDGNVFVKSFPISTTTYVYKNVLCANTTILRDAPINASNTRFLRLEVGQYLGKTLDNFEEGLVATKNYTKNNVILKNFTKGKPDIIKDSTIGIVFQSSGGFKIKVEGKALKEGSVGDLITVKSAKYNKIYQATVTGRNEVTVKI